MLRLNLQNLGDKHFNNFLLKQISYKKLTLNKTFFNSDMNAVLSLIRIRLDKICSDIQSQRFSIKGQKVLFINDYSDNLSVDFSYLSVCFYLQ